jgi:hypothetical protein
MSAKRSWYNFIFATDEEMNRYFPFVFSVAVLLIVLYMCRGCGKSIPDSDPEPVIPVENNIILQYKIV